jgi:sugar lactone lactonase YvrE
VHDAGAARQVRLPLNNPTSVAIGSDALYITTARHRLSEQERAEQARPPFVLSGHAASLTPY